MNYLPLATLLALSACATPNPYNESPADLRVRSEIERINSVDDRCDPAYQRATNYEFFEDDQPNCPNLRRPAETAEQRIRRLICTGPIDTIADDDPALVYFMDRDESFEDHKVALAIERVNGCDGRLVG